VPSVPGSGFASTLKRAQACSLSAAEGRLAVLSEASRGVNLATEGKIPENAEFSRFGSASAVPTRLRRRLQAVYTTAVKPTGLPPIRGMQSRSGRQTQAARMSPPASACSALSMSVIRLRGSSGRELGYPNGVETEPPWDPGLHYSKIRCTATSGCANDTK
jgi:hypothetical protein